MCTSILIPWKNISGYNPVAGSSLYLNAVISDSDKGKREATEEQFVDNFGKLNFRSTECWERFTLTNQAVQFPFAVRLPDHQVTPTIISAHNLWCIGTPKENSVVMRCAPNLPVKFSEHSFILGNRTVDDSASILTFVYPNPLEPSHYIYIESSLSPIGYSAEPMADPDYDFSVHRLEGKKIKSVLKGLFSTDWQLDKIAQVE